MMWEELKFGLLVHFDFDCFMLGDAYVITSISDNEAGGELYHMGEKFPYDYKCLLKKEDIEKWCTRGETLEMWKERIKKKEKI